MPNETLSSYEKGLLEKEIPELEYAALFSKEGEFIKEFIGGIGYDHIPLSWKNEGMVLTHNHISGDSFGIEDLGIGEKLRLSEIRVVTEDGIYSMKSEGNNWPSEEEIRRCVNEIRGNKGFKSLVYDELFTENNGRRNPQNAGDMIESEIVCKGIAKKYNLHYFFVQW